MMILMMKKLLGNFSKGVFNAKPFIIFEKYFLKVFVIEKWSESFNFNLFGQEFCDIQQKTAPWSNPWFIS